MIHSTTLHSDVARVINAKSNKFCIVYCLLIRFSSLKENAVTKNISFKKSDTTAAKLY